MPAKSKIQQDAAGAALSGASINMAESKSETEQAELASTEGKDLPEKKGDG